jgi:hypothetical protein
LFFFEKKNQKTFVHFDLNSMRRLIPVGAETDPSGKARAGPAGEVRDQTLRTTTPDPVFKVSFVETAKPKIHVIYRLRQEARKSRAALMGVWGLRPQRVQGRALAFLRESMTSQFRIRYFRMNSR